MNQRFVKKLMANARCNSCGRRYRRGNITFLWHQDFMWLFKAYCPECHSRGLVAVLSQDLALSRVPDLTEMKHPRFSQSAPVSADDVLDMHNFLKEFEGDFFKVLGESS